MSGDKRKGDGGGAGGGAKSVKKARYAQAHKAQGKAGANNQAIPLGTHGMLVTCVNGYEDRTAREIIALIEEHYDKVAAASGVAVPGAASAPADGGSSIASALAAEVAQLKDRKQRRFTSHDPGVRGCVYIKFPDEPGSPDPCQVALSICDEACATKSLRSRHASRLLPLTHVVFASLDEMKATAPKLLNPHFSDDEAAVGLGFAIEYEHRSSDKFDRLEVINAFVDVIKTPPHKVNLTAPVKTVLVQITRNACGVAVVDRYRELNKYNLRKCAEVPEDEPVAHSKPAPADKGHAKTAVEAVDSKEAEGLKEEQAKGPETSETAAGVSQVETAAGKDETAAAEEAVKAE